MDGEAKEDTNGRGVDDDVVADAPDSSVLLCGDRGGVEAISDTLGSLRGDSTCPQSTVSV